MISTAPCARGLVTRDSVENTRGEEGTGITSDLKQPYRDTLHWFQDFKKRGEKTSLTVIVHYQLSNFYIISKLLNQERILKISSLSAAYLNHFLVYGRLEK